MEGSIMKTAQTRKLPPDDYLNLVQQFPLRPLRNESEHREAVRILIHLSGRAAPRLSVGESDYVDALVRFVADYDQRNPFDFEKMSPREVLNSLMLDARMTITQLGRILGNQPAASLILHGKRQISRSQIFKLADHFKVEAGLFLQRP
jgi:antitoxin component HigA of HigAB toxin-antitoxin module